MIKNIFFDVDGTIYEEKNAKVKSEVQVINFMADKLNMSYIEIYNEFNKAKREIFDKIKTHPNRNNRTIWYEKLLKNIKCNSIEATTLSNKYWQVMKENIELYDDFKLILPELKNKYDLYVITDELLEIQKQKLSVLKVDNYFKSIISSTDVGKTKPDKEIFEYALKTTKCKRNETVMIGDNPFRDIEGAKKVGIRTIWFRRGKYYYYPIKDEYKPDFIINNYIELMNIIK